MSELYCTVCSKFVEPDGMTLVQNFRGRAGRRGGGNVATFLDKKSGLAHVVLTEKLSAKYRTEPKSEPQVTVVKREPSLIVKPHQVHAMQEWASVSISCESGHTLGIESSAYLERGA